MAEPKLYEMTWEEVEVAAAERQPLTSWEGHLLSSRDRQFEPKNARESYLRTLTLAFQAGRGIPEKVLQSEPALFARLTGQPAPSPAPVCVPVVVTPAVVDAPVIEVVETVDERQDPVICDPIADECPDTMERETAVEDQWQDGEDEEESNSPEAAAARHLAWLYQ